MFENKEWLFSGVLISVPIALMGWFFSNKKLQQNQRSGNNSTNIQVGESFTINQKRNDE